MCYFKHALGKLSITRQCTASPTPEKLQTAGLGYKSPQVISASLESVHVLFQWEVEYSSGKLGRIHAHFAVSSGSYAKRGVARKLLVSCFVFTPRFL